MSEEILHRLCCQTLNPTLEMTAEIYNETLIMTGEICLLMTKKLLPYLGITAPNPHIRDAFNHEMQKEGGRNIHSPVEITNERTKHRISSLQNRQNTGIAKV